MNVWDRTPIIASRQDLQAEIERLQLHIQALNRALLKERSEKAAITKRLQIATQRAATLEITTLRYREQETSTGIIGRRPPRSPAELLAGR